MDLRLTDVQEAHREAARRFATETLGPWAAQVDRDDVTPAPLLARIRRSGYLGAALPPEWGGGGLDPISHGLAIEEIARASSTLCSVLTAHGMSTQAIARFGTHEQRARWLPDLCCGEKLVAFALSEPEVGSAASDIRTRAVPCDDGYVLTGAKRWVTLGQDADLFLVFAHCEGEPLALLVERGSDSLEVRPTRDMLGSRGAQLAELELEGVRVPADHRIGPVGGGISFVAAFALDHGRFAVAWGSTGIIQACLDACVTYTCERHQGGSPLADHQLVRRRLADMLVAHTASRALCYRCADLRERRDPRAAMETRLAKYHASAAAERVAADAVHLHGANGCSPDHPVSRYLRDATVMGIIEGTHEMHQLSLAGYAFQRPYLQG